MNFLKLAQILIAVLLISTIVIQSSNTGLGSTWGGTSLRYRSKKGLEKFVLISSAVLTFAFAVLSLLSSLS